MTTCSEVSAMDPQERLAALRAIPEEEMVPRSIEDRWSSDEQAIAEGLIQVEPFDPGISAEQAAHEPAVLEERANDRPVPPVV